MLYGVSFVRWRLTRPYAFTLLFNTFSFTNTKTARAKSGSTGGGVISTLTDRKKVLGLNSYLDLSLSLSVQIYVCMLIGDCLFLAIDCKIAV